MISDGVALQVLLWLLAGVTLGTEARDFDVAVWGPLPGLPPGGRQSHHHVCVQGLEVSAAPW